MCGKRKEEEATCSSGHCSAGSAHISSLWKRVSRALGRSRLGGAQRGDGW